jgi:hypothetical protein
MINMKKIMISSALLAATFIFGGCVKDKGFENHEYGINSPEASPAGVGFPWATASDATINSVEVKTSAQTVAAPTITLFADQPAPQDIHVNLTLNMALVTAHNADPAKTPLTTFPAGAYSIPSLKVTIPKGERMGALNITIPTTTGLSFSDIYGLGFTITSVDEAGYKIADNLKNVVIGINVANQYAGDYNTSGYFMHPTGPRALNDIKTLGTKSAVGCIAPLADLYPQGYYFDFDVALGTGVQPISNWVARNATPAAPGSGFFTADVPNPGGLNPYPATGPTPGSAPWLHSTYNNTYNYTTKTFFMHYGYNGASQSWTRQAYEKWVKK